MRDGEMDGYWEWFRLDRTIMRSGSFDRGRQVGQHELRVLKCRDRAITLLSLLDVLARHIQRSLSNSQRLRGNADPAAVQGVHGDFDALTFFSQ